MNNDLLEPTNGELFASSAIKNQIKTRVLFGKLCDFLSEVSENFKSIAVVCTENNFPFGKKIKESFLKIGKKTEQSVVSDSVSHREIIALKGSSDLLVAVGDEPLFSAVRLAASIAGVSCALIPLNCRQCDILSSYSFNSNGDAIKSKPADFVIIDKDFYLSPKKQYACEAFAEIISSIVDVFDYKLAALCGSTSYDRAIVSEIGGCINLALAALKAEEPQTHLITASLIISGVKEYSDFFKFSSSAKTAEYLGKMSFSSYGERKYRAFLAILPILKIFLDNDLEPFSSLADTTLTLKEMSEIFRQKEYLFVKNLPNMPSADDLSKERRLKRLIASSFSKELGEIINLSGNFQKTYNDLYGGRRRLSDYTPKQMKKAIKFAAYSSENNLLSLLKDEGYAELL